MENWIKLLNEFGYMVIGSHQQREVGQILSKLISDKGVIEHPWIVREETTGEDFNNQRKFLGRTSPVIYDYYYRVTTD